MSKHHHHHHPADKNDNVFRYKKTRWLTALSALVNLTLAVLKLIVGQIAHSHALFADGLHSLSDLLTDLLVFLAARVGHKDADQNHPYGHERFETAGTLVVSLLLIMTGLGILLDLFEHMSGTHEIIKPPLALAVITISIVANEVLFQITQFFAKRIDSKLLMANAWHHRSDALSSVVVLFSVIASQYGYPISDTLAAVFVAGLIIKMGVDITWHSIEELVDTSVEEPLRQQIEAVIKSIEGVHELHELRTRRMGSKILVDVHLIVAPRLTVSEGHFIGDSVQRALTSQVKGVNDITVHIDPEDDCLYPLSPDLPSRSQIEIAIDKVLAANGFSLLQVIESIQIHYLHQGIELDIFINDRHSLDCKVFKQALLDTIKQLQSVQFFVKK